MANRPVFLFHRRDPDQRADEDNNNVRVRSFRSVAAGALDDRRRRCR